MNDEVFSPQTAEQESAINLDTLSSDEIEHLIVEGNKILKKRKEEEIKQFQAEVRRKAKEKGLKVSFEDLRHKSRSKADH